MVDVVVAGLVCRDLVVSVEALPGSGSVPVGTRLETLGGAANQAVGLRQLGLSAGVVGVVGEDVAADLVLDQARRDGIDVSAVVRRAGGTTPLVVGVVEADGTHRLLEHVPRDSLLTPQDVRRAAPTIGAARAVVADLQQPDDAVVETVRLGADAGALVLLDGAPEERAALDDVWRGVSVLRADAEELGAYLGSVPDGVEEVVEAARELVGEGPGLVALEAGGEGNVLAWDGGARVLPLLGGAPVDATGGGDAFVAGLLRALLDGADPETAGWWATVCAAQTVARLGGRPDLDAATVVREVERAAGR
ncbi:PfkB family carbohydrate kinase [Georgenia phoenicis]|uniref:PfkB family carbohydrate kinase n=1 Tax=unclassified Georgenia TaxID=2626815 RepID=UPI0039B05F22